MSTTGWALLDVALIEASPSPGHSLFAAESLTCVSAAGLTLFFPFRDVVLDLPLGSLLLSVCPRCCRRADVCDAPEAQAGQSHLHHCCQHRLSGFCNWSNDY